MSGLLFIITGNTEQKHCVHQTIILYHHTVILFGKFKLFSIALNVPMIFPKTMFWFGTNKLTTVIVSMSLIDYFVKLFYIIL